MPETPKLDPHSTALILIDLQRGIVARPTAPHASADVVKRGVALANAFRERGALVVLVRVAFAPDDSDRLKPLIDAPLPPAPWPADFADLLPEVGPKPGDLVITKHQWGAFYGTELDLQLRRRGIRTIVIGGISTNFGVESTARDAWERAYQLVFVEDAMAGMSAEAHGFATGSIFPRLGIVRSTGQVMAALPTIG